MKKVINEINENKILRGEDFIEHVLGRGREYGINIGFREFVITFGLESIDNMDTIRGILYLYDEYTMKVDAEYELPASAVFDALYDYACLNDYTSIEELYDDLKEKSKWEIMDIINEHAHGCIEGIYYGTRLSERGNNNV